MKFNRSKSFFAVMIFMLFLTLIPCKKIYAAEASSNMDVVFVLDSSGSMKESDPEEIRIEAIKMFLDMSQVQGNKFGLVAYSDSVVREHNLDKVSGTADKDRIKSMASNIPLGQKTDTGAGLLEGVKLLDDGHDKNNRPLIILLSDGKNDPARSSKDSLNDLNNAISECKSKGYPVYTIGLNYDGTVDKAQLSDISTSTNAKNYITKTASDLPDILTDIYADNSKVKVQNGGTITANGDYQDVSLNIPNSNVLEANVSMLSDKPVDIKLLDPSKQTVSVPSDNVLLTSSKKYSMLKLIKPSKGEWTLKVKGVSGSNIKISYVFNYDFQVAVNYAPVSPKNGDKVKVESYLATNGQKISDTGLYSNLKGTLVVRSLSDNSVKRVPLNLSKSSFNGEYVLPSTGKYELKVDIDGSSFSRESAASVFGGNTASAVNKPKAKNSNSHVLLYVILGAALVCGAIIIFVAVKKRNVYGFGRVELNVRDENSGEMLPPQFRNLDGYTGSFTLFEVLGLKEEYAETSNIKFIFNKDDSITVENKSDCAIQKSGRKIDKTEELNLYNGNRITVFLNKVSKSVTLEFHVK